MKCSFDEWEFGFPISSRAVYTEPIEVIGLDSEAYDTGEPFLFCLSDGVSCHSKEIFDILFADRYEGKKFVVFNLKYEEGALLYYLPRENLEELRVKGKTTYEKYKINVISRKEFRISNGHRSRAIYDIMPYYASSLDNAAQKYLGKSKIKIKTKKFTPEYVARNIKKITEYCQEDSILTKQLADLFLDTLAKMGLFPRKLISTGYISAQHFSRIHDSSCRALYERSPKLIEYAFKSYAGGKFEVYKRGFGNFYEYDINSAYPYQIANLYNLTNCEIVEDKEYRADADYGWLNCNLFVTCPYSPVPFKLGNINLFPQGRFNKIIGKKSYEYLIRRGCDIEIIDAVWIYTDHKKPYKKEIERLYRKKNLYKHNDEMKYLLIKILMNSLYGKFAAITPIWRDKDNSIHHMAGQLFNPMYADIITEGTRLEVCEVCDKYDTVVAVHTDSVISTEKLPLKLSDKLGEWDFKTEGAGVIVGSGIYQIGEKIAFRGFNKTFDLCDMILSTKKQKIEIKQTLVRSWKLALFQHDDINKFTDDEKILDLNFDNKRIWDKNFPRYKNKMQPSQPIFINESWI